MATTNNDCGYWLYKGNPEPPESPSVLTRTEKGQALTHLEMDVNLASFYHTSSISEAPSASEGESDYDKKRREEQAGLYVTLSYAPIQQETESGSIIIKQYDPAIIKIQHTTDEILEKIANETVPGNFAIDGDAYVNDDLEVNSNVSSSTLTVSDSASVGGNLRVDGTASFSGDVYIEGNVYVNGVLFSNISKPEYNSLSNPGYAVSYSRMGTVDTASYTQMRAEINALRDRLSWLEDQLNQQ